MDELVARLWAWQRDPAERGADRRVDLKFDLRDVGFILSETYRDRRLSVSKAAPANARGAGLLVRLDIALARLAAARARIDAADAGEAATRPGDRNRTS